MGRSDHCYFYESMKAVPTVDILTASNNDAEIIGMGRTWQISGRICLPCGKNLSSGHIAKCDPKFSSWKKL